MGAYGIDGDPAGMRTLADLLAGQAERLGAAMAALVPRVRALEFEGPAARAFDTWHETWQHQGADAVAELQELAGRLRIAANEVEAEQAAAERAARERAEELVRLRTRARL